MNDQKMSQDEIRTLFNWHREKATTQRIKVVNEFHLIQDSVIHAQDIYNALLSKNDAVSLPTIHITLKLLVKFGLLESIENKNGVHIYRKV